MEILGPHVHFELRPSSSTGALWMFPPTLSPDSSSTTLREPSRNHASDTPAMPPPMMPTDPVCAARTPCPVSAVPATRARSMSRRLTRRVMMATAYAFLLSLRARLAQMSDKGRERLLADVMFDAFGVGLRDGATGRRTRSETGRRYHGGRATPSRGFASPVRKIER